jgi:uncharacterized protein YndB with AHSA1/START domain
VRPVSASITIDAPREQVYDLLLDLSARPAFCDHFLTDYRLLRIEPVGIGAGARFHARDGGGHLDSVIDELEPPYRIREHGHGGRLNRVPAITEWRLVEAPGGTGCEVEVTFWTEPSKPYDLLRDRRNSPRRLGRDLRRALERLRDLVESGEAEPRLEVAGASRI